MNDALKTSLASIASITEEDWELFESILSTQNFSKGSSLLREGQICKGTYFVTKGAFRTFHLKDGNEIHTAFYFENDFVRDIESLSEGTPSKVTIQALEDSEVTFISKEAMFTLYERAPSFQMIGRKLLELMAITERRYARLFTDFQPRERYEYVLKHHPELIQRVPLQYLATFLGITRETLSRIRKRTR